jgi:mannosyltransferase
MGFRASVTRRSRDRYSLAALGIVLVATLLRVYTLTKQPLWYDELISVTIATYKGGLESIWNTRFYPHPPLFVALLYLLFKGFAPSEYSARLLPLFGSVLAFPLLYRYTADLLNKRVALIALLLLAFSPFHIFFSQDARPYSLLFTLVVLTLWVLHRALATNRAGWWVAHAVCLLLLLYLHYFGWLVLGGEIL